jgi:hypothetical protein
VKLNLAEPKLLFASGYDMDLFDASIFKQLFEFVASKNKSASLGITPLEAGRINNKQFLNVNMTIVEDYDLF